MPDNISGRDTHYTSAMRSRHLYRRLLPAILVAISGMIVLAWVAHSWAERREIASQSTQSKQQLILHARALEQLIDRYRALPQVLALDPELRRAASGSVSADIRHRLNIRLEEANRTAQASTLTLTDRYGTAIAASNWRDAGSNVGEHYDFRPYIRQALREGHGRFYGIGVTTNVPGYFLAELMRDDDGQPLGMMVIKIQLSALEQEWPEPDGTVLVSDRNGIVFLASHESWRYRTLRPLDSRVLYELGLTRQYGDQPLLPTLTTTIGGHGADAPLMRLDTPGQEGQWLWSRVPLPESGWTMHLLRDVEESIANAGRQAAVAASTLWLALVLTGVFLVQRQRMSAMRRRSRAELEAMVEQHAKELHSARSGLLEAAENADSGLSRQLDHLPQGVVVVDADLRIMAWNRRYIELFRFPPELIQTGRPIEDVFRYNAQRGLLGAGPVETAIQRRLEHLRRGTPHIRESEKEDGTVLEIRGNPLPDGGFVTSYADITSYKSAARELRSLADALETRIAERTADLEHARRQAEAANRYKTRFVAAAVHDLLQPLNAARMFLSALRTRLGTEEQRAVVADADAALAAQDSILTSMLDISRLEAGTEQVNLRDFPLDSIIEPLSREFELLAQAQGLFFARVPTGLAVHSDPDLLGRILRNLLSNAVRYTKHGRILIGCRRTDDSVQIQVWDTGPGIPLARQPEIFEEFRRLDEGQDGSGGSGLGLAIVERIARMLGHRIELRSWPGRGSVFSVLVPRATAPASTPGPPTSTPAVAGGESPLDGRVVWYIHEDPVGCQTTRAMLERWGCLVPVASSLSEAIIHSRANIAPDFLLLDTSTGPGSAPAALSGLGDNWKTTPMVILLTTDRSPAAQSAAADHGWHLLPKPLRPPALRALMTHLLLRARRPA